MSSFKEIELWSCQLEEQVHKRHCPHFLRSHIEYLCISRRITRHPYNIAKAFTREYIRRHLLSRQISITLKLRVDMKKFERSFTREISLEKHDIWLSLAICLFVAKPGWAIQWLSLHRDVRSFPVKDRKFYFNKISGNFRHMNITNYAV